MSAPRSNARNRSSVLTLTSTPGISRLPLVTMSLCLAASSSSSPVPKDVAVSCAGDDTTEFCDGAYSAVASHGSSLSPALSSLRRASSAQKPGSTALCHGSNRMTSESSDDIAAWERGATTSCSDADGSNSTAGKVSFASSVEWLRQHDDTPSLGEAPRPPTETSNAEARFLELPGEHGRHDVAPARLPRR